MNTKHAVFLTVIVLLISGILIYNASTTPKETNSVEQTSASQDNLLNLTSQGDQKMPTPTDIQPTSSPDSSSTSGPSTAQVIPFNPMGKTMPPLTIDKTKTYSAVLHTTAGDITIQFNASKTPYTVNNFIALANVKFYDNTIFHRVISGFMIQGGDPTGTGSGGPGYRFDDEVIDGEYTRGTVAMANAGANTNGSQFFIMHKDAALPKNYVIFGKVTKGMDAVDKIATAEVTYQPQGEKSKPVSPVKITTVDIKVVD